MSGKKQHYIPQFFLKGFAISEAVSAKQLQIHLFRLSNDNRVKAHKVAIKDVGCESFFYSNDNNPDLDDHITKYETQLAKLVSELRNKSDMSQLAHDDVKEIISHLVIRSKHLRTIMTSGIEKIYSDIEQLLELEDQQLLRKISEISNLPISALDINTFKDYLHARQSSNLKEIVKKDRKKERVSDNRLHYKSASNGRLNALFSGG